MLVADRKVAEVTQKPSAGIAGDNSLLRLVEETTRFFIVSDSLTYIAFGNAFAISWIDVSPPRLSAFGAESHGRGFEFLWIEQVTALIAFE